MGKSNNTMMVGVRIPNELLKLKQEYETPTEFIMRALFRLRDDKVNKSDGADTALLAKLISAFVKNKVKAMLSPEDIKRVKELYKP